MDPIEQYLVRATEIIGDRTPEEQKYDAEMLKWLGKGRNIKKAIQKANDKYPKEALQVTDDNLNDVAVHYDYLLQHEAILARLARRG